MKSATKRFLAFIMLLTIVVGIIPTNLINVFASYPKGDGWEQIDGNTFIIYNNRIIGTSLIEIFNLNGEVESDTYKFAYSDPDSAGVTWEDFGTEVINSSVYDIEFNTHDCAHIYFSPQKYWTSSIFYHIIVEKHYSPETEPADSRNPAIIDNLQDKNFGKFDTEAEFMNAVKNRISASWANSEGSGKVDPSNIKVEFALNDSSVNGNGETVRSYTVTVNITEGTNWLASEQKTVFEEIYWTVKRNFQMKCLQRI